MNDSCVFCKIRDGEIPGEILHQDEYCFVIRDINPLAPVHLLVIPLKHFAVLSEVESDFDATMGAMFDAARNMAAAEDVAESGYRLVINQNRDGGQDVFHLHLHVIGGRRLGIPV